MAARRKLSARAAVALGVSLALLSGARAAGPSWATLQEPPTGVAPAADIIRAGHLGREIEDTQAIIHFYTDIIGLGITGPRDAVRPFKVSHALAQFAELGEDANAYDSVSRAALLPIPGTAGTASGTQMTIEAIEIKGIKARHYNPPLSEPGASYLKLIVRDLDKTLEALKAEHFPVITAGEQPLEQAAWPGISGQIRAVFVRDPDGYPVELLQITPAPETNAPADSKVLGARVALVVDNLETTARMVQSLVGPDFKLWASPGWMGDAAYEKLTGVRGPFRLAQALVPGSPVVMEFVEYEQHNRNFIHAYIQDPGTAHFLFFSQDVDRVIPRVKAGGWHTLSRSNAPVFIGPTTRSLFVPDPEGFWLEFMDRDVKTDPAAKK